MKIFSDVYNNIIATCPQVPPEIGGILGEKNGIVCAYYFDKTRQSKNFAKYIPNVKLLNMQIEHWENSGISFCGIFHSHMPSETALSSADIEYISKILFTVSENISSLYFPLVLPKSCMLSYRASLVEQCVFISEDTIETINRKVDM